MSRQTIGAFLQTQRKAKGYTQQQVADMLGISNRTLSAWETDKAYPDLLSVPALADIYGVTADDILRGERQNVEITAGLSEEITQKLERVALKNRLKTFSTQNYALIIVACAGIIMLALCPFFITAIFLVIGSVALISALVLRVAFFRNAEISADIPKGAKGELSPAQKDFSIAIRSIVRRCLNVEGTIFTVLGALIGGFL